MMDKILDKLGIYDLVAVLLPGICIISFSVLAEKTFWETHIFDCLNENTLLFWVASFVVGTVFQEVGSVLHRNVIYRDNKILLSIMFPKKKRAGQYVTQKEIDEIGDVVLGKEQKFTREQGAFLEEKRKNKKQKEKMNVLLNREF